MKKETYGKITYIAIVLFLMAMLMYAGIHPTYLMGEWDDYSLPVASLFHDHNFSVSKGDVAYFKELFPEWAGDIKGYELSGYKTAEGAELSWYFPVYSILCMPMTVLLWIMKLPRIYTFSFTNILLYGLALLFAARFVKTPEKKRLLLVLTLAIHPAVFYINYVGAEVCLYALLIMAAVCWYNGWHHRGAFFVALAGTMNATILSVGLVMIAEYLLRLCMEKEKAQAWPTFIRASFVRIVGYGCCYIIGILPMIYNYVLTGHINLTASYEKYTVSKETVFERAYAYLFDLNYGMLPYFPIVLWLAVILLAVALGIVIKETAAKEESKKADGIAYMKWALTGLLLVLLYSLMIHINSGMDGMARYNTWGSVLFIFGVVLYYDKLLGSSSTTEVSSNVAKLLPRVAAGLLCLDLIWSAFMLWWYDPNRAANTAYIFMNPLAVVVLEKAPGLYNPLHSTFASRTLYKDGCYEYDTPVVYFSYEDGSVRKVLATVEDAKILLENFSSGSGADAWWEKQVVGLGEKESYISVPKKYDIRGQVPVSE